ncbi:argininosuccinate lyase [Desulfurivibrio alkaliphilus]|uniref:Argininosuccinate lyase n=1 Tax=Desulfurivibrio alkaliphilus (strain DSM 19089 / UNIQEM U267 / AHT2) TaxID=589865 RepID=D6Z6B3_DESAT|nr:argininosuccinate lyase [Desulfurivibrio alkaliphilus]ADH86878.1 argininosuccinate lyase [Desulfurivibrio alkaliphilus AHT 2]
MKQQQTGDMKMWGGRFAEKTAASVEAFTCSVHFDCRLYRHDIAGSRAHARMLARQGLISDEECRLILGGLDEIEGEIERGEFVFRPELEDIHMNIEKALAERIGPAGEKLHTARSRNDQVNLDFRLYLREECDRLDGLLAELQRSLVTQARRWRQTVMPGYTHLQRAQPVLVAHHLLAYFEMFKRDRQRLADCRRRINVLPLGAAALAGTGLPIDREYVAELLDFPQVSANSLDTVADRDFVIEFASAAALIQVHLSRLAEELVLWTSEEFAFVELPDAFCTGSSIMPQKKNPDVPELIRGKSGRVVGHLMALLTLLKGLPLAYNRDLQEDKEPIFDTVDTVSASLALAAELMAGLNFREEKLAAALRRGCMTATDLADYLVRKQVPFRQAHAIVGRAVAYALEQGRDVAELSLVELKRFAECIEEDVFAVLSVEGSVNSRNSLGGTGGARVDEALAQAESEI